MKIAMLVPGLSRHDAVSNDALGMTAALREQGHEVAVFAMHASGVDEPIRPPSELARFASSPADLIIYHYCIGWDLALDLFRRTPARRVVRYHNITPPEFFEGWAQNYVDACIAGRAQLDEFAALDCELYLGDSPFNLEDFLQRGVRPERCAVLPPFHPVDDLVAMPGDLDGIPDTDGAPLLLMVGRIAPNKNHLTLVDTLSVCLREVDPLSHLLLIGRLDPNLARYGEALEQRIDMLGVRPQVTILAANGAQLRAAYGKADALVMLSGHEGFCVPLIEAMALGTPIIAYGSSAVGWTAGDAGLVWDEPDPFLAALSLARLRSDRTLRDALRQRGLQRYRETFAPPVLAAGLRKIMTTLAG